MRGFQPLLSLWMLGGANAQFNTAIIVKSGVGTIVDMEMLYVGVRNTSCNVCTRTESMGVEAQKHECHKT